ncbi:hypothetical protein AZE42_04032 [Rhizopogon vesiculosus]|uniref:Uncharacterized protein n=1 Tax=Rhizopogon vesiculosus TaxID=180088 RepID=A0A1J8Q446_9AGAM|nr:hypothetical protein AZE42_04032 [Rhizopogon vesiculosus]
MRKTRVGCVSARVNECFILCHRIAEGGDKQARHAKVRTQEASCFPRFRIQTESGTRQALNFVLDLDQESSYRGAQAEPKDRCLSWKMQYRESNSDSSYDIVPVRAPKARRPPRAPTTVQIVNDDFDAMTQEDFETASEMCGYDGVTQLHVHKDNALGNESERYSGVYGEWVERHEVNHQQAPDLRPEDYLYVEELARRVLDAGLNDQESIRSSDKQQPNTSTIKRHGPEARTKDIARGAKVSMWREEVARNELDEFGNVVGNKGDTAQRIQQWRSKSPPVSKDIEQLKSGLRRSRSSASHSYLSEKIYTPVDLNADWSPKKATTSKREKRATISSPSRSERIYTMAELKAAELKALSKHAKASPPRQMAAVPRGPPQGSSTNSNSPPRSLPGKGLGWPSAAAPVMGIRSTSTSAVEMILASCQPTLLHIAPVLASLGIRREEHLRALVRLREETRDREMKEEVLKQGVTVLEWAILMDRLQSL